MDLNTHTLKELSILIGGPVFQFLAYFILLKILPEKEQLIKFYHYGILFFNLLPIYPLDGGKIIRLFLELFIPYKSSYQLIMKSSYIMVIIIGIVGKNIQINGIVMIIFLLILITKEKHKIEYIYNKFLLERYIRKYYFLKSKIIFNENNFYKNKKHILKINENYILEKDYLKRKYQINYKKH